MLWGGLHSHSTLAAALTVLAHIVRLALHAWATCVIEMTNTIAFRSHSMTEMTKTIAFRPQSMVTGLFTGTGEDTG